MIVVIQPDKEASCLSENSLKLSPYAVHCVPPLYRPMEPSPSSRSPLMVQALVHSSIWKNYLPLALHQMHVMGQLDPLLHFLSSHF